MPARLLLDRFDDLFTTGDAVEQLRHLFYERALHPGIDSDVPVGWRRFMLDDCTTISTGTSISASNKATKYAAFHGGLPFVATKDVLGSDGAITYATEVAIPENEAGFRVAEPGTILLCAEGGSAGRKIGLVEQRVCFGNKLFAVVADPNLVTPRYLLRIFQSAGFLKQFQAKMTGIIGGISLANFKRLTVNLPPLDQQAAIDAELADAVLRCSELSAALAARAAARRAAAVAKLAVIARSDDEELRISAIQSLLNDEFFAPDDYGALDDLRDAILDASLHGCLAKDRCFELSTANCEPATDTRTGERVPTPSRTNGPFAIPAGWRWVPLGALVNPSRTISYGVIKLGGDDATGVPTLRCSDVRYRRLDLGSVKVISPAIEAAYQRTRLKGGEVLVNIRGTLGGCAVVPPDIAGFNIAREVAMVDPNSLILPRYLLNVVSSPYFNAAIEADLRGIAYKGINLGSLARILVPLPPHAVQQAIVEQVDTLMAAIEQTREALGNRDETRSHLLDALIARANFANLAGGGGNGEGGDMMPSSDSLGRSPSAPHSNGQGRMAHARWTLGEAAARHVGSRLEEALLVSAIVDAFYQQAGQPVGNFRIQKAIYFSRRRLGERDLDQQFLKKAAGPYNPTLRYEGGIAQAKSLNFIREAKGRFGFGYITGAAKDELRAHLSGNNAYRDIASWIVGHLRYRDNDEWEVLATVDYAVEALRKRGAVPGARDVLAYIADDDEWRPKVGKLSLTIPKIEHAMMTAHALLTLD